jgi:glycosyltransferase involved in cell wall biosynthesis
MSSYGKTGKKMNKIIHINSSSSGGAYIFTKLLHDCLLEKGFMCSVLTRFYEDKQSGIFKHSVLGNISFKRFLKKIFMPKSLKRDEKFEIFSVPLQKSTVFRNRCVKDSDIIHLHWVADLLSVSEIAEISKTKKVLWTLHDMNPFTGGCHHSDDCVQYIDGCKNCPQLGADGEKVAGYFNLKKEAFEKIDPDSLTIISPSKWMFEKASESALLKKFKHILIPHFVDTKIFKYRERNAARGSLCLSEGRKIFLYVSAVLENERKGFSAVFELAKKMKDTLFIFIGKTKNKPQIEKRENIVVVDDACSPELVAKYYSAADYLLNFSVAESFGLTTAESLCCGIPVICYDIPVMREHIEERINGIFVEKSDIEIKEQYTFDRKEISEKGTEKYGVHNFEKYLELYGVD